MKKVIVIGAGIVGLAHALAAAKKGYKVEVFERSEKAVGASIRNFGMVWPVGQPVGKTYDRALRSREVWLKIAQESKMFIDPVGSVHVAYQQDELAVLQEFFEQQKDDAYKLEWVEPANADSYSQAINPEGFLGGVFSESECIVDPRQAIATIPSYLEDKFNVVFNWNTAVTEVNENAVRTKSGWYKGDHIFVCSGADFEILFPEAFTQMPITKCKLQMMRTGIQPNSWRLGAALAGGLTLTHYKAFESCLSLEALKNRIKAQTPLFPELGIHVMVSQNGVGELVIGDSHEYGLNPSPFDREDINAAILNYLKGFLKAPDLNIKEQWHGVYAKMQNGASEYVNKIDENVTIVNGLGGAGMTLSFGLAEETTNFL